MSGLPFPPPIRDLLALSSPSNRALLFDKGMDRYGDSWQVGAGEKESFLKAFAAMFRNGAGSHFDSFLARREAALMSVGAQPVPLTSQTRLVVGLGLPSPLETGFLFDRVTGCPYLPGSSVKGLLRATARLVQQGGLRGDKPFWDEHFERIFGPEIVPGSTPKTGGAVFYDAFPAAWPSLKVDVLTPHYGKFYRDNVVPGDWENPVPVPFLTVAAGTKFHFYFQASTSDREALKALLGIALDWLGIGAKKSAGYGMFGEGAPAISISEVSEKSNSVSSATRSKQASRPPEPPEPPPSAPKPALSWPNVELSIVQGQVIARRGKHTAACSRTDVNQEILDALAKHRTLRVDVEVLKLSENRYRLATITGWRPPARK